MGNTGNKIVVTLRNSCPPNETKPNTLGDEDYMAPYEDLVACALSYDMVCPVVLATAETGLDIEFEFSLPSSSINNPAVKTIKITGTNSSNVVHGSVSFALPLPSNPNYFTGVIHGSLTGAITLKIEYLDNASTVLKTCSNLVTVNLS